MTSIQSSQTKDFRSSPNPKPNQTFISTNNQTSISKPTYTSTEQITDVIVIESDEEETSIVQKISGTSKIVASTRLPSSPVSIANQEPEKTMNDSIVDSSFSFLMDNLVTTIRNGGPKLSSSKPVSQPVSAGSGLSSGPNPVSSSFKMPPFVKWLSSDDDDNDEKEEDPIVPTSQPVPHETNFDAQPAKRSRTMQEPPQLAPKPVKRSKTVDQVIDLPRIDNFQYTSKDLKEANRATRKKKELLAEMELHMAESVYSRLEDLVKDFQLRVIKASYTLPVIFWKRNINAAYDKERDIFIPCHPRRVLEKTFVLYYHASVFFEKLRNHTLKADVSAAKQQALAITPNEYNVILVVEGYDILLNKIKAYEQRLFKNQVLQGLNVEEQRRRRKDDTEMSKYPSSSEIEHLVNKAQIDLKANIFMVRAKQESIMWLNSFTHMIGQSLYDKFERNQGLANLGNVKSGADTKSTFLQSMKQFNLMTQAKADILYVLHQSLHLMYTKLRSHGTLGKDNLKRNIVPPSVDSSMKKFFTADDPDMVIN